MANNIFSSEFISSAGEQYKVDLFAESYEGFTADIIGGGSSVFFVAKDWTDFLTNGQPVLLDGVTADFINSFTYNEAQDRTQITLQTSTYSTQTTIENNAGHGSSYIPDFDPIIIDVHTEWEAADDITLDSIKASNTVITYANKNAWFDRFMDLYLESNDNNLKLIIYKDNTGWELEWVGNIVIDLLEWDNAPKPIPITIKAIDGLDKLKDIPYDDIIASDTDVPLNEHISNLLEKNDLSQFWGTLDPYLRESIEYKSNEVSGTLTDAHSPLDYVFMHDRMFYDKNNSELVEGMSCYDALRAIIELFNCRMFISKGVYYIQQVKNYNGAAPTINYREYTKSLNTYTSAIYGSKLSAGNTGVEDLSVLAGGKFGYLAGLYRTIMPVRNHEQVKTYWDEKRITISDAFQTSGDYQSPDFSMGEVQGGVGTGAYLTLQYFINMQNANAQLNVGVMIYQGGTSGVYRPIFSGSGSQVILSKNLFENWDLAGRMSSSTSVTIRDANKNSVGTFNISSVASAGVNGVAINLTSGTYNASTWKYVETDDYTETYFLTGGSGNALEWVKMEYADNFLYNIYYNNTNVNLYTPEIPFSADMRCILIGAVYGGVRNPTIQAFNWMVPKGSLVDYSEAIYVENPNTDLYTKELELPPLNISERTTLTSYNCIRVSEDYLTTNAPNLVYSETWDANFSVDYGLNATRVAEAMSHQYKPVERYMGGFVGQYYPHNTIDYEAHKQNNYYFHTFRKHYLMDEVDGEWFESINQATNVTPTIYDSDIDDLPDETGGGVGDGLVAMIDNSLRGSLVDADSDAGTTTSLTIEANELELKSGESIIVYDPTNGQLTETLTLSSDLAVGATTANFTSQVTTKNIKSGMVFQPKKDTLFNRTKSLRDDLTTAESDISTLQSEMDVVQGRQLFTVNNQTSNYTLQIGDEFTIIQCDSTSTIDVTVPTNSSEAFELGTVIKVLQYGLGSVKVAAAVGVTIRAADGYNTMAKQYGVATLTKMDGDEWLLEGEYLLSST